MEQQARGDRNPPTIDNFIRGNVSQSWQWKRPSEEVELDGKRPARHDTASKIVVGQFKKTSMAVAEVLNDSLNDAEKLVRDATNNTFGTRKLPHEGRVVVDDDAPVQGPCNTLLP